MPLFTIARDIVAFPTAWISGEDYTQVEEKAHRFLYSTARVLIACGIIWAIYKIQHTDGLRKLELPTTVCTIKLSSFSVILEPFSTLINLYLLKKGIDIIKSIPEKWKAGIKSLGVRELVQGVTLFDLGGRIWHCFTRRMFQWPTESSSGLFSTSWKRVTLNVTSLPLAMGIATLMLPESRLGIGSFLTAFGLYQLYLFNRERWFLRPAPTYIALYGIVHVVMGLGWLMLYGKHHNRIENSDDLKKSYLYRGTGWISPGLAWLATGGQKPGVQKAKRAT